MHVPPRSIYVEIDIDAPIERVWDLTQSPELHWRWDLRFSDIQYLPRPDSTQPQKFLYVTRIGMGLCIRGEGETVGSHDGPTGERTSALKFWSDDRKSLIRTGSGFWKYIPPEGAAHSVRFLTRYDYDVRFGTAGRLVDRLLFRPLIGWATAWSFDRLRLWIEKGIDPEISMQRSLIQLIVRLALSLVWIYQGLVPKLIYRHRDELQMLHDLGTPASWLRPACNAAGGIEVIVGLIILLIWKSRWPLWLTLGLMPAMGICVAIVSQRALVGAFNPVSLNASVFALAAVALLSGTDLPSARRCLRRPIVGEDY